MRLQNQALTVVEEGILAAAQYSSPCHKSDYTAMPQEPCIHPQGQAQLACVWLLKEETTHLPAPRRR
jgi:hypothetical protein